MLVSNIEIVKIRPLTIEDAPSLLKCLQQIDEQAPYLLYEPGERDWDIETTRMVIEQSNTCGIFLGAFDGVKLIGYLLLQGATLKKIAHSAQIVVAVDIMYRQQGIGKRLLTQAIELAQKQGLKRLELSVIPENIVAKKMYENFGFFEEGLKKQAIRQGNTFVDEIIMAKLFN